MARNSDPLVRLALPLEAFARDNELKLEPIRSLIAAHGARIARARLATQGWAAAPDATHSTRLTYGPVLGLTEQGAPVEPFTTFKDLYDRARLKGPEAAHGAWALPARWQGAREALDPRTPLNFASQVDIVGGNSGSPVINLNGECVGVIFDGNLQSLAGEYFYDESVNRAIAVDVRAISEALRKVYGAGHIVDELLP
jgi:hypothetical protein